MNIPYGLLPDSWLWAAVPIYLVAWLVVIKSTSWNVLSDNSRSHAFFGGSVFLLVLWNVTATSAPGLEFHFLGAMLATLMFRWQLAFVLLNLVLFGTVLAGQADWQTMPVNGLTMGLLPVLAASLIFSLADRKLPNHFFVYVFVNAFFGAGTVILTTLLAAAFILVSADVYSPAYLFETYLPFLPLMFFPEAFITGLLATMMVAFAPAWVLTFDDARYLQGK